jgi:hypothetical protein
MWNAKFVFLAAFLVLACRCPARGDDQKEMRALVAKAIRAAGGEAALAKYKAMVLKVKGKDYSMGEAAYTGELAVQYPEQERLTYRTVEDGEVYLESTVVNKDKGWIREEGKTKAMDKKRLAEERERMYAQWVTGLLPVKDKACALSPMGEVKVGRIFGVGVNVTRKGHREVHLIFDKKTCLLIMMETQVRDEDTGKEVWEQTYYHDYKDVRGIQLAMRTEIKRDGKGYAEEEVTEVELVEMLDDGMFTKP